MEEYLFMFFIVLVCISFILSLIGLVMALAKKETRKKGVILMIIGVVSALIGFGGCIGMFS